MKSRSLLWIILLGAIVFLLPVVTFAQLSGDYVIGTGQTYTTLGAAITALNSSGASGTVRFLIDENLSETGSPIITTTTLNGTNTLVIKPNTGKTPTVTFSSCVASGNNAYSGLTIDGVAAAVGYVTVDGSNTSGGTTRDLTFDMNDGTAGRYCINAVGNADYITVKNCKFVFDSLMDQSVSANRGAAVRTNGTAVSTANDHITIQNNEIGTAIQAAGYGILINNASSTYSSDVNILDNIVFGSTVPINTLRANTGATALSISGNTVSLIGFDASLGYSEYGVWVDQSSTTVNILNNKVVKVNGYNNSGSAYPLYGIYLGRQNASSTVNIANNFVSNFSWQGTNTSASNLFGIYLAGTTASTYNIYYNTVYLNGDNLGGNTSSIIALNVASANSTVNLKNNILVNTADLATAYIISFPTTTVLTSDYNDLYVSGSNANVGIYNAVAQKALADWRTASSQDANSVSVNPANSFGGSGQLTSLPDLHWVSKPSNSFAATPLGSITTDIDGDTRDGTYPYMGADEIAGQPLPVELTSFTALNHGNSIILHWSTASEKNNFGFDVERRQVDEHLDGSVSPWRKISFVTGFGTSNISHEYSFMDPKLSAGHYAYRLKQVDNSGVFKYSMETEVEISVPRELALSQNYPNPFNPSTTISFTLAEDSRVSLKIFDMLGHEVATLVNENLQAGIQHNVLFDASRLASGLYFYRLEAGRNTLVKKLMLVK